MNNQTKYFFIIKYTFIFLILNLALGFLDRTLQSYFSYMSISFDPLFDLIGVLKVVLVIVIVVASIYLVYSIIMYFGSKFYTDYRISVFEAIYHGFIDIHQVYDKIHMSRKAKNIQIDFKRSTIYFNTETQYYCVKYLDLFGTIEGKIDSEFWASVSKPKKQYSQKVYMKKVKFENPYRSNQEYVRELRMKTNVEYHNYVVISGFYNMKFKNQHILAPYEVLDFIK